MVGVTLKDHNFFKPNTVYEIRECLGEMLIVEIGQGAIAEENETVADSPVRHHWATDIGYLIGVVGSAMFLSRRELTEHIKAQEELYERDF